MPIANYDKLSLWQTYFMPNLFHGKDKSWQDEITSYLTYSTLSLLQIKFVASLVYDKLSLRQA